MIFLYIILIHIYWNFSFLKFCTKIREIENTQVKTVLQLNFWMLWQKFFSLILAVFFTFVIARFFIKILYQIIFFSKTIRVGVCGKALFYYNEDFSTRLVEWIEIVKLLGASKIFLYKTTCHKNIQKVLDFYEKEGTVKLITFYYPPPYQHEGTFLRWVSFLTFNNNSHSQQSRPNNVIFFPLNYHDNFF